ncbi:uncharacterized protein LOC133546092 [Nerophis ophidion]|uniref:uncharacterized protein LOC133546092 n=1 Tax=Nerophis ophidion TaxID=159077 RepID=UPI002ADFF43D|nr:uncharacterized protein LOC133546092 [Nerophis ophidion]
MWIVLHLLLLLQSGASKGAYKFSTQTLGLGQNVSLICPHEKTLDVEYLFWIRLISGNTPEILAAKPSLDPGPGSVEPETLIQQPRVTARKETGTFVLEMSNLQKSDTASYFCLKVNRTNMTFLNETFLHITGLGQKSGFATKLVYKDSMKRPVVSSKETRTLWFMPCRPSSAGKPAKRGRQIPGQHRNPAHTPTSIFVTQF